MDVLEELAGLGGVARRSALGRSADAARSLAEGFVSGALRDLGGGWVAMTGVDNSVVAARRFGATITCASAAPFHRL